MTETITSREKYMHGLDSFEAAVLGELFSGDDPSLKILREQMKKLRVKKREHSGVGFFTEFEFPLDAPRLPATGPIRFGDVIAEIEGMEHGAGFLLFIDNGLMTMLEGYSNANEDWPNTISKFRLSYLKSQRDLSVFTNGRN